MISQIFSWLQVHYIEIFAALTGIAGVWLTSKQNIFCWPIGLLNVVLSMYVFIYAKLYYDFILQIFYFFLTIYGWYSWTRVKSNHQKLSVQNIDINNLYFWIILTGILTSILGYFALKYTDASLPYFDAFTTIGGIIATFWTARKIIENWIAWIIIDITCVVMYFYKELYAFSVLYLIFTILAFYGFYSWRHTQNLTLNGI